MPEDQKLHIPDDLPPNVTEQLNRCQEGLDALSEAMDKKEAGDFSITDLQTLAQINTELALSFPGGDPSTVGLPVFDSIESLEAFALPAQTRTEKLLAETGEAPLSMDQLLTLSQMDPDAASERMLNVVEEKGAPEAANVESFLSRPDTPEESSSIVDSEPDSENDEEEIIEDDSPVSHPKKPLKAAVSAMMGPASAAIMNSDTQLIDNIDSIGRSLPAASLLTLPKIGIELSDFSMLKAHLEEIANTLRQTKDIFYDLYVDWPEIKDLEDNFDSHIAGIGVQLPKANHIMTSCMMGTTEDEDLKDKSLVAAFALASTDQAEVAGAKMAIDTWKDNTDVMPEVKKACQYARGESIEKEIIDRLQIEDPEIQAEFIDILVYRRKYDSDTYKRLAASERPEIQIALLKANALSGAQIDWKFHKSLLSEDENPMLEPVLFAALISGQLDALKTCRNHLKNNQDKVIMSPLYIACAGQPEDLDLIVACLENEDIKTVVIMALGIWGTPRAVEMLLEILSSEDWRTGRMATQSLELIIGAGIEPGFPEIEEGPEGREQDVSVRTDWYETYSEWWEENKAQFLDQTRYRRGKLFNLGCCVEEMQNPRGNYWSRQAAYWELRMRSGDSVCHFEADWYVADQIEAIEEWKLWWVENQSKYRDSQWPFAGT